MKIQITNHKPRSLKGSQVTKRSVFGHWSLGFGIFQRGYTLVELLMYMGIFIILLSVLLEMFSSSLNAQLESQANSSVQEDGRYLLTRLAYDIERSSNIVTPASPGNSGPTLTLTISGQNYTYASSSGNLQISNGGNNDNLNGYDTTISGLNFKRLGNTGGKNTITITFTLLSKTLRQGKADTRSFNTTVGTR